MRGEGAGGGGHDGRGRALRVIGTVLAAILGIAAVWLIVTSDSAKHTQIGALLGFWAVLIGAYPVLGTRHPRVIDVQTGQELDLRPSAQVERVQDAAERVEYERRLQMMVRHEIQTALGSELASLRSEVAALRNEILEKVGGQIRLERIETTRLIGSDIEALQHEVRQLQVARQSVDAGTYTVDTTTSFVQTMDENLSRQDAVARQLAAVEAEARLQAAAPAQVWTEPEIVPAPPPIVQSAPQAQPAPQPAPAVAYNDPAHVPLYVQPQYEDPPPYPFESMPRIQPFAAEEFVPEQPTAEGVEAYAGRRRTSDGEASPARHGGVDPDWEKARPAGGRRRRESSDDDILSRILEREGMR